MSILPYLLIFLFPLMIVVGAALEGSWWYYLVPVTAWGVLPLLDMLLGDETCGVPHSVPQPGFNPFFFSALLWLYVPVQLSLLLWGASLFSSGGLTTWEQLGLVASIGISNGMVGATVAHELGHRMNRPEQLLGLTLLCSICYGHWRMAHNAVHHKYVATLQDPASSRFGQSFYEFWPQTVFGGLKEAWHTYRKRNTLKGRHSWYSNPMVRIILVQLAGAAALIMMYGPSAALFFFGQSFLAISALELINFIEHYGLMRKTGPDGQYEKVTAAHAWNSNTPLANWLLLKRPYHSHHHLKPSARYPLLELRPQGPQLPTGYLGMMVAALIPGLWRSLIDERLTLTGRATLEHRH
jgi:alkane 1-monooxygenase